MTSPKIRDLALAFLDARQVLDETSPATVRRVLAKAALANRAEAVRLALAETEGLAYVLDGRLRFVLGDDGGLQVEQVSRASRGEVA